MWLKRRYTTVEDRHTVYTSFETVCHRYIAPFSVVHSYSLWTYIPNFINGYYGKTIKERNFTTRYFWSDENYWKYFLLFKFEGQIEFSSGILISHRSSLKIYKMNILFTSSRTQTRCYGFKISLKAYVSLNLVHHQSLENVSHWIVPKKIKRLWKWLIHPFSSGFKQMDPSNW